MLEIDDRSQAYIDDAVKRLKESSADSKIAFSSYTHAAFDQESRIMVGDIRWRAFAESAEKLGCQLFPLTWEMQPPGVLNEIMLLLPTKDEIVKSRIRSGLATLCWWSSITPPVMDRLSATILDNNRWTSCRNLVGKQLAVSYPGRVGEAVLERLELLKDVYIQVLSKGEGKRLSEVSEELYQQLLRGIFGELADELSIERESYFGSRFGASIAECVSTLLREGSLSKLVGSLRLFDRGLFIGGEFGAPFMVTFSPDVDAFIKGQIDSQSGQVDRYGSKIESNELSDLIETSIIMPTGKLFDALLVIGEDELVVHDGNDYGGPEKAKLLIPDARGTYHQLFPDNQDSFPPIQLVGGGWSGQSLPATMASLFIWNLEPGLWAEKLAKAVKSGKSEEVVIYKEVAKC